MTRKSSFNIVMAILGFCLFIAGFFVKDKKLSGIMIGIGAGATSNISGMINKMYLQKHPELQKQNNIELNDERNIMIRNQAKAKAADIMQWIIVAVTYITIIISTPLWFSLLVAMLVPVYYLIIAIYSSKYRKEL
ncbi:MAG: hypothetical protein GX115_17975 [Ruminiclostridium sp.]|nr:hypothetical protein [Ruminiclostridium sp.]